MTLDIFVDNRGYAYIQGRPRISQAFTEEELYDLAASVQEGYRRKITVSTEAFDAARAVYLNDVSENWAWYSWNREVKECAIDFCKHGLKTVFGEVPDIIYFKVGGTYELTAEEAED